MSSCCCCWVEKKVSPLERFVIYRTRLYLSVRVVKHVISPHLHYETTRCRFPCLLVYRVHNIHGDDMQQWIHYGAARSQQCIVCANCYIQQFSIMGMLARNPFIISIALAS